MQTDLNGVSIIVCCYNSAQRLQPTLTALAQQTYTPALDVEVVLVDNASTDDTAAAARAIWKRLNTSLPLRILHEPKAGLTHARNKGIQAALYGILIFCDDDNWLCDTYVQTAYEQMTANRRLAACGGLGFPVFATEEPVWFKHVAEAYATGPQATAGEKTRILNLYGAGLVVRKQALQRLYATGFKPVMQDRVGAALSSGGDTELTYALVLLGYELDYVPQLKFQHYLPAGRLQKTYLQKLFNAFGTDGPVRNLYHAYASGQRLHGYLKNWNLHLLASLLRLAKYYLKPPKPGGRKLYLHWNLAYLKELLALRNRYGRLKNNIEKISRPASVAWQPETLAIIGV